MAIAPAQPTPSNDSPPLQTGLARLIAIDVRNLAVLRVGLAIIICVDLAQRVGSIVPFLTDAGVVNRDLNRWLCPPGAGFWSVYWLGGSAGFAATLLAINGIAAAFLLLGYKTRWATAACLVLAYSLQIRNPLILTAGHILLRMLLFWSLFLPLGAVWSLDASRRRGKGGSVGPPRLATARELGPDTMRTGFGQVASVATAAIMIQVAAMYLFPGLAKWNDVWLRGDAMSLAMQLDMYVKPLGRALLQWPQLLILLTFLILILETIGPLLLWMPAGNAHWRLSFMVMFWSMHIGIWLTMSIGIFSVVAMLAWVVFIPGDCWRALSWRRARTQLPDGPSTIPASAPHPLRLGVVPSMVCGVFLVYVIGLNVANIEPQFGKKWFGASLRRLGNAAMVLQQFKMFERPAKDNLWWRLVVTDAAGKKFDALPRVPQPLGDTSLRPAPEAIYASMPNQFWRRLLFNLATIELPTADDRERLDQLKQRTGETLWAMRHEQYVIESSEPVVFWCGHQSIAPNEWDSPAQVERWASISK